MKIGVMIAAIIGSTCVLGLAQNKTGDFQEFDIFPSPPPLPALKYELNTDPIDQVQGNAAELYKQASALINNDLAKYIEYAENSAASHNYETLNSAMNDIHDNNRQVFDLMDAAGKRDQCDWQSKLREEGFNALLPYLNNVRVMARLLHARAIQQIHAGKMDEAVATLRDGYELAICSSKDLTLINGLVALGICRMMDGATAEMMKKPQSPNLYWALATLPRPIISLRYAIEGERQSLYNSFHVLRQARSGDLSADQWREILKSIAQMNAMSGGQNSPMPNAQAVEEAMMAMLPEAKDYYAQTRSLSADEVAKIDKLKVVAAYCFEQYEIVEDDQYKWAVSQPFPVLIAEMKDLDTSAAGMKAGQKNNPFWELMPNLTRAVETYVRNERQIAALTAVEAIRSYAAANGGKLPTRLSDITDTPAPVTPSSGQTFNYTFSGAPATRAHTGATSTRPVAGRPVRRGTWSAATRSTGSAG